MLAVFMLAAEEAAEPSKTPFYIAASCLVAFAALLSIVGTARHETFPPTRAAATGIMLLCALLVAGTMFCAVITA
jgi:hypothetical protein